MSSGPEGKGSLMDQPAWPERYGLFVPYWNWNVKNEGSSTDERLTAAIVQEIERMNKRFDKLQALRETDRMEMLSLIPKDDGK